VFSARLTGDLTPNRLTRAVRQRRSEGLPIVDLTCSNPTQVGFEYPSDLLAPLGDRRGLVYSPEPLGLIEARRAVAEDYVRRGVSVDSDRIVLTASTSDAYSILFKLMTEPGDEVLVPRPSYPLFDHLTVLDGVIARPYDLEYHGVWSIDRASVEDAIGPRTRALLMVSPNNPTGSFISPAELDAIAAICARHAVALIVDEVFADYELEAGASRASGVALARTDVLVFALGGLSKSVGLPQVKLGWIAVAGPASLVGGALERLELICDTYLTVSTLVQRSAAELLKRGAVVRAQISTRIVMNYGCLKTLGAAVPSCRVLAAAGGWYAVVQVPTLGAEEDFVLDLLNTDGVLTHPGYFFDFPHESFVVISLLPAEPLFAIGIERLFERATPSSIGGFT
jgi:alanine-synthesizing transaminase